MHGEEYLGEFADHRCGVVRIRDRELPDAFSFVDVEKHLSLPIREKELGCHPCAGWFRDETTPRGPDTRRAAQVRAEHRDAGLQTSPSAGCRQLAPVREQAGQALQELAAVCALAACQSCLGERKRRRARRTYSRLQPLTRPRAPVARLPMSFSDPDRDAGRRLGRAAAATADRMR